MALCVDWIAILTVSSCGSVRDNRKPSARSGSSTAVNLISTTVTLIVVMLAGTPAIRAQSKPALTRLNLVHREIRVCSTTLFRWRSPDLEEELTNLYIAHFDLLPAEGKNTQINAEIEKLIGLPRNGSDTKACEAKAIKQEINAQGGMMRPGKSPLSKQEYSSKIEALGDDLIWVGVRNDGEGGMHPSYDGKPIFFPFVGKKGRGRRAIHPFRP
jgi:hypothetical protein